MPIVVILLLAILVGLFGFWDTLQAIIGAVAVVVLAVLVAAAVAVLLGVMAFRRGKGRS
ncbi:MAG: hypothetical protein AB1918_00485 [Pseudomonadota bacterium]